MIIRCIHIFLLIIFSAQTFAQEKPIFLNELNIELDQKIDFSQETFQRQYQSRVWTAELRNEIKEKILTQIQLGGYYFAALDSSSILINSAQQTVSASFFYEVGKQVTLQTTSLVEPSIPLLLQDQISE